MHAIDWYNARSHTPPQASVRVRSHALAPAWLAGYSEDSSFTVKTKTLADKISISQIVNML